MQKSTLKWFGMALTVIVAGAAQAATPLMKLEYFYAKDGTLIGRAINGARQNYEYDRRGQLLAVKDASGNDVERYVYDPAGNILSKTVNGKTTTNQPPVYLPLPRSRRTFALEAVCGRA